MRKSRNRKGIRENREGKVEIGVVLVALLIVGILLVGTGIVTILNLTAPPEQQQNAQETYTIDSIPPTNPSIGWLWYDTTSNQLKTWNGYNWQQIAPIVGGGYDYHAAKHEWGGIDPIEFHKLSPEIRVASEFATSGSGTAADPYINGIQAAYDDCVSAGLVAAPIFIRGSFELTKTVNFDSASVAPALFGVGNGQSTIIADNVTAFELGANNAMWIPIFENLRFACTDNTKYDKYFMICHGKANELQLRDLEFAWIPKCLQLICDNAGMSYVQINNCWILQSYKNSPTIGIDIPASTYQLNDLGIYNCRLNSRLTDVDSCAIRVGDNAIKDRLIIDGGYAYVDGGQFLVFEGNKSAGSVSNMLIGAGQNTNGLTGRFFHFKNITSPNNKPFTISNLVEYNGLTPYYFVWIGNNNNNINIINNDISLPTWHASDPIHIESGANGNGSVRNNIGYVTEKSNSTTILNGNTHVTVTHEMDVTPTSITVTGNHSEVSACWIVNITATQFEIWVSSAVTYDRVVYWYAEAR